MEARDIMHRPVSAAGRITKVRDVALRMLIGGYSGMPITEPDGKVVGIVSEMDIIRALRAGKPLETTTAEEIMTGDVAVVDVTASETEVMDLLEAKKIVRLPVTEDGQLVGVISRSDVLRVFFESEFLTFD